MSEAEAYGRRLGFRVMTSAMLLLLVSLVGLLMDGEMGSTWLAWGWVFLVYAVSIPACGWWGGGLLARHVRSGFLLYLCGFLLALITLIASTVLALIPLSLLVGYSPESGGIWGFAILLFIYFGFFPTLITGIVYAFLLQRFLRGQPGAA